MIIVYIKQISEDKTYSIYVLLVKLPIGILVLINSETGNPMPFEKVIIKSKNGMKYFFTSDENGEVLVSTNIFGNRILFPNEEYKIYTCNWQKELLDGYDIFNTYDLSRSIRIIREVQWSECD